MSFLKYTSSPPAERAAEPRAPSSLPARRITRLVPPRSWNLLVITVPAAVVLVLGFRHRWVGDDGLIYTRAVRQILAGNGPVHNVGERAETSTGTLWQWLLALCGFVSGQDPAVIAVALGLVLATAGLLLAGHAAQRLHSPGHTHALVPLGLLVVVPVQPVWDYTTSGLETGLSMAWVAGAWSLLVRTSPSSSKPFRVAVLVVIGLGPLVRPDLAVVSVIFLAVAFVLLRTTLREALPLTACAAALPAAYEVFRAGYYGILVPLPGLAKDPGVSSWGRGLYYLANFTEPYRLWMPFGVLLLAALVWALRRITRRGLVPAEHYRRWVLCSAPVVAGLVLGVYAVKVGGDFMHGRFFVLPLLLCALPIWAMPPSRTVAVTGMALACWAAPCLVLWRAPLQTPVHNIWDSHRGYQQATRHPHPISQEIHGNRPVKYTQLVRDAVAEKDREGAQLVITLAYNRRFAMFPLARDRDASVAGSEDFLGHSGVVVPLDGVAVDPLSLGYPLGAHGTRSSTHRAGHEKPVDVSWTIADYTDPGLKLPAWVDERRVAAARKALTCGPLAELQESVRAPLTPGRFWKNLTGAWDRTALRYPHDPLEAERHLCHR
ncbi:hypothetical protein FE633_08920 [Streptomyces montanus]|uniref:Terminal beta-(1->2)-arabinofuranosyltransferase C-terminal domain-containing protein n=1 Tax=Streptomyces montanus TaxID=2580423 RepID=A0A5R9G0D3_9ACTN|nr:hypothetical protein [Streptomyces montanus]TLS46433.1 hypothetical protein FE633_08920 [Streptomyces montanus]